MCHFVACLLGTRPRHKINRLPEGQFTSNDAYLFASQAQEITEHGVLPARDMHRWLPYGRDNGQLFPLYAYAIVYTHKAIGWVSPKLMPYHIQVYAAAICFTQRLKDAEILYPQNGTLPRHL